MSTCETVNKSGKSDFCCIDSELPVDPGSARHGRAPEFRKTTGDTFQNVSPVFYRSKFHLLGGKEN